MINTINIKSLIGDKFNASIAYEAGDLVFYLDKLYMCKTAVTTPEAFDSSKWEEATVTDALIAVKARLSNTN